MADINFNSIKVQLELPLDAHIAKLPEFQFHKGTIRTQQALLLVPAL